MIRNPIGNFFFSISVVVLLSIGPSVGAQTPERRQGTLRTSDSAPDFSLQDVSGKKTVKLAELKGRPIVLIFGSCT